jgi:hypothetical protein
MGLRRVLFGETVPWIKLDYSRGMLLSQSLAWDKDRA